MAETAGLVQQISHFHTLCSIANDLFVINTYYSLSVEDNGHLAVFCIRAYSSKPQDV